MKKERVKRYSQSFRQQVVREYESGASVNSLQQKYGIGSGNTIKRWVKQYGRLGYRSEVIVIQHVDDQLEVKEMKERIINLERTLADTVLENRMLQTTIDVAGQALDIDLKKTFGNKSLPRPR